MTQIALIGGAHIHTPGFAKTLASTEGVATKYVWDPNPETAGARQAVTGGEVIDEPAKALADDDVAAVVICSETVRHGELVAAAVEAGKHLFVEKPLGMSGEDAWAMAEAIEKAGLIFQTGYFMRGRPEVRRVRELVRDGQLGKVTRLRLSLCHHGSLGGWFDTEWRWMADPKRAGCGALGDLGTHVLDLLLWITRGDAVEACTGHVAVVTGRYDDCDETGEGMIRFASGALATVAGGWVDRANPNFLEVSGTEGHARITGNELFLTGEKLTNGDGKTPVTDLPEPWPHAFDLFLAAVKGEKDVPLVSPREAAERNVVMDAIYQGARQEKWVRPQRAAGE